MNDEHRLRQVGLMAPNLAIAAGPTVRAMRAPERRERGIPAAKAPASSTTKEESARLFSPEEMKDYRLLWELIQGSFAAEPRRAVEQADGLAAGAMKRLGEIFAEERAALEGPESASNERLRLALSHYRSFFRRLFSL